MPGNSSPRRQRAVRALPAIGGSLAGAGSVATGLTVGHPVVGTVVGAVLVAGPLLVQALPTLVRAIPVAAASIIAMRRKFDTPEAEARIGALTKVIDKLR